MTNREAAIKGAAPSLRLLPPQKIPLASEMLESREKTLSLAEKSKVEATNMEQNECGCMGDKAESRAKETEEGGFSWNKIDRMAAAEGDSVAFMGRLWCIRAWETVPSMDFICGR